MNPNERVRVLQARAIVERGQLHVGEVGQDSAGRWVATDLYGLRHPPDRFEDVGLRCRDSQQRPPACAGRLYPAKAPGIVLLGVPALAIARAVGFVRPGLQHEARATWVLRIGAVTPLMLLALWVLGRLLVRCGVSASLSSVAVIAAGIGTGIFPYSVIFVGHAAASAMLLFALSILIARLPRTDRPLLWAALAGHAVSWAVLLEYHAVVAASVIAIWIALAPGRRAVRPGFLYGALAGLAVHATLHWVMFGSPWKTAHYFLIERGNRLGQSAGFLGIVGFRAGALWDHLFDSYMGLLPLMPWLCLAVLGAILPLGPRRDSRIARGPLLGTVAVCLAYLLFVSSLGSWRMMNGWAIGPRYLLPVMLPLAFLAALGWSSLARRHFIAGALVAGLCAASIVIVTLLTVAFPNPPSSLGNAFSELALPLILSGCATRNLGLLVTTQPLAMLPFWLLLAFALLWTVWAGAGAEVLKTRVVALVIAVLVALLWVSVMASHEPTPEPKRLWVQRFAYQSGGAVCPGAAVGLFRAPGGRSLSPRRR